MASTSDRCVSCFWLNVLLLSAFSGFAASQWNVKSLPGFAGDLPFELETGYIGVGEQEELQLFYFFVESQRSPRRDPLMLWLTGGPGCSTLSAFMYESGPVKFNSANYTGGIPELILNEYTWTQKLNIIYLDAPVGTGYSYSTTQEGYYTSDTLSAEATYQFLRKWLYDHPQFLENQLYIGGDSYSGIIVPMVVLKISDGNLAGVEPTLNLQGYMLGNPKTDYFIDTNAKVPFAHRLALISNALYKLAEEGCDGNYVFVDSNNAPCLTALGEIGNCLARINEQMVLEPSCTTASPEQRRFLSENHTNFDFSDDGDTYWCRDYGYAISGVWANDKSVHEALHVRPGTKPVWKRCNSSLAYTDDVTSSVPYHRNLTQRDLRALIYSGDHDMAIPYMGTQEWIASLNLTSFTLWTPWYVDAQVAGYWEKSVSSTFSMRYATVKGAGHVAPEYKPKQCFTMVDRWLARYPF